jgi:hypothetical protein
MLLAHVFGASLVEGLITAFGFAYIQQHHPEYLGTAAGAAEGATGEGDGRGRPAWQLLGGGLVALLVVLFGFGLITGGGDVARLFGADWSQVDWPSVTTMLIITAILALALVPLAYLLLPRRIRAVGATYVAAAILAPLGLIAPGFAFGEGSTEDLQQELGYVPEGLHQLSGAFSAPLADYNSPLPFFSGADAPLWHAALGYELAGLIGMLLLGAVVWGLTSLLVRGRPGGAPPRRTAPVTR